MTPWIRVITEPLGLAGFAIFLAFGYLATVKRNDERRWVSRAAMATAVMALVGGLLLAYVKISKSSASSIQSNQTTAPVHEQVNHTQQISTGDASPNVQGIQGSVTISVNESAGENGLKKSTEKAANAGGK